MGFVIDGRGSELRTPILLPIPRELAIAELVGRLTEGAEDTLELGDVLGVRILLRAIVLDPVRPWTRTSRLMLGLEMRDDRLDENPPLMPEGRELMEPLARDDTIPVEGRLLIGLRLTEPLDRDDTIPAEGRLMVGLRPTELERLDATGALDTLDGRLADGLLRLGAAEALAALEGRLADGLLRLGLAALELCEDDGPDLLEPPRPFAANTGVKSSAGQTSARTIFLENSSVNMVCLLSIRTQSDSSILMI